LALEDRLVAVLVVMEEQVVLPPSLVQVVRCLHLVDLAVLDALIQEERQEELGALVVPSTVERVLVEIAEVAMNKAAAAAALQAVVLWEAMPRQHPMEPVDLEELAVAERTAVVMEVRTPKDIPVGVLALLVLRLAAAVQVHQIMMHGVMQVVQEELDAL
jgi:hypothetical protein